jgi:RNA polymerase sigma-70 factor (ECF subfamily)
VNSPETEHSRWFAEEVHPHEPALRAYLHHQFPTLRDIDDLVQEAYARLIRARQGGKFDRSRAYLFVTARNAALDLFRRNRIISLTGIEEIDRLHVVDDRPDAAEAASHEQELAILAEAIRALPARCREVVTLRGVHGWPYRTIAQKLGISENTVNAQLAIGLLRCRQFLRARGVLKGCQHAAERSRPL